MGKKPKLSPQQEKFADLLASGRPDWDAYHEAGYEGQALSSLVRAKRRVREAVMERQGRVQKVRETQDEVTRQEIIESLRETREMAKSPDEGQRQDLNAANKADELLGKTVGLYVEVKRDQDLEAQLEHMSDDDIRAFVVDNLKQLDPNYLRNLLQNEVELGMPHDDDDTEPPDPSRLN